jgi:hypothetical protein
MKLAIQLLDNDATLNNYTMIKRQTINQGETPNVVFQLLNSDSGNRFLPSPTATTFVEIARFPDILATGANQRTIIDPSIRRQAAMLFPADDRSIWYVPLTAVDTNNIMSSNIRVTVTDGNNTFIAVLTQAIYVTRSEINPEPNPNSAPVF